MAKKSKDMNEKQNCWHSAPRLHYRHSLMEGGDLMEKHCWNCLYESFSTLSDPCVYCKYDPERSYWKPRKEVMDIEPVQMEENAAATKAQDYPRPSGLGQELNLDASP